MKKAMVCCMLLCGSIVLTKDISVQASGGVQLHQENPSSQSSTSIVLGDLIDMCGQNCDDLILYSKKNGIILRQMTGGKLDYSMNTRVEGSRCTICIQLEGGNGKIQEIYVKPEKIKLSDWVHMFNQRYGPCIEIEKRTVADNQQLIHITWLAKDKYLSLVKLNDNLYIYITPCE